nr:unnamed protein product [Callosobruchus chinensis]
MERKRIRRVDPAILIKQVKKFRVLYDTKMALANPHQKKRCWFEVAAALFGADRWKRYDAREKDALVREIQVKWKSLRDTFTKALRKEREQPNDYKRKYVYYKDLSFLAPFTSSRKLLYFRPITAFDDQQNGVSEEEDSKKDIMIYASEKDSEDGEEDDDEPKQYDDEDTIPLSEISTLEPVQFIHVPNDDNVEAEEEHATQNNDTSRQAMKEMLEEVVQMHKEDRNDDPMGNKKFLLSLLPFIQKVPDDVNLEVRLQLLSVLQTYCTASNS